MAIQTKIVSATKEIEQIVTSVGGVTKDIRLVCANINGTNKVLWQKNPLLSLNGGEKYEENAVWKPGRYKILVQSGGTKHTNMITSQRPDPVIVEIPGAIIEKEITITQPFIIRAYCGGGSISQDENQILGIAPYVVLGTNPYSGTFKVNGWNDTNNAPSANSSIFGNAGGMGAAMSALDYYSSGNCLGDGVSRVLTQTAAATAAGSCLHIMPADGVFGTDYYYAFHTTGAAMVNGASGGAYGGGAGGCCIYATVSVAPAITSQAGGDSGGGVGGAAVSRASGQQNFVSGNDGVGAGHGYATKGTGAGIAVNYTQYPHGAGAFFNGTSWEDITTTASGYADGKITIEFLGF